MDSDGASKKELIELYNRAMKKGNSGVAMVASSALTALARAEAANEEARALSRLANEM